MNTATNTDVNQEVFLALSEENQTKVECIYYIAVVLKSKNLPPLNTRDFDTLYDKSVDDLRTMSGNVKELLDYE